MKKTARDSSHGKFEYNAEDNKDEIDCKKKVQKNFCHSTYLNSLKCFKICMDPSKWIIQSRIQ